MKENSTAEIEEADAFDLAKEHWIQVAEEQHAK
jgi:hypothetical protein